MEDTQIIELFFARDERAIRETDMKYGKPLTGMSTNITGSLADAEECVNDTYLAAWNQIPPDRPDYYDAYVARILRNLSFHCVRRAAAKKRSASVVSFDEELSEMIPDTTGNAVEERELGEAIDRFLGSVETGDRYLFLRRYFWGDTPEELSALTGMSKNAISLRLMRIRRRLKTFLTEEGYVL